MKNKVIRTERGWAGHFICADQCKFKRNTLLVYNDIKIVISSVGLLQSVLDNQFIPIKAGDVYYETMAFHSKKEDLRYHDADVSRHVFFNSQWVINEIDADDKANDMHEDVVIEITEELEKGNKYGTE